MESPYAGRAIIDEHFDGIHITIPTKKNWFVIIFLGFWLCGWVAGETFALREVLGLSGHAPQAFIIIWVCGWTVGGIFAIRTFWWALMGKEIISVEQGALTIDKKGAFFYRSKSYDLREAKNFRAQEENYGYNGFGNRRDSGFLNLDKKGTIRFDYGMQTIKFGDGLDEAEGNFIIGKLRSKKLID